MVEVGRKRYEMIARRCDSGGTFSSRAINVQETGGGRSKWAIFSRLIFGRFLGGRAFDWIGNKRDRRDRRVKQAAGGFGTHKALTITTLPERKSHTKRTHGKVIPQEGKSQSG